MSPLQHRSGLNQSGFEISPERDQHLAGESNDSDALDADDAAQGSTGQVTAGLVAHRQPSQFHHARPRPRIAGFTDTLNETLSTAVPSAIDLPEDNVDGPDDGDGIRQHMPL